MRARLACASHSHRSPTLTVVLDEWAGTRVQVALWGADHRPFVEIAFASAGSLAPEPAIESQSWPTSATHVPDPALVTDPHSHDLTVTQAKMLHRALGYLLTLAERDGDRRPDQRTTSLDQREACPMKTDGPAQGQETASRDDSLPGM